MDEETGAINVNVQFNPAYESFFNDSSFYKVLWGSAGCFHGSTLILTTNGYKQIKDVSIGESVLSFNETTKAPEFKKVLNVFNYNNNDIGQRLITFHFKTFKITCTHGHKFYYKGNWVEAWELAKRTMDASNMREWVLFHKQPRKISNKNMEGEQYLGNNETFQRPIRIFEDYDSQERCKQANNNKNTQACCGSIFRKSEQLTGSESQKRYKVRQQRRKFGMGDTSGECITFIQEQSSIKCWVKKSNKYSYGRTSERNKECGETINTCEEKNNVRKVWSSNRNYKAPCLQTGQVLASCEIDLSKIISIEVSTKPITVYDLEVEYNHNYCITEENIIVHNSGKSHAIAQKIVMRCLQEKGHRAWAFRKVSTYVDASVYDTIREVIDNFGVTKMVKFNKTDKTIEFPYTNSIIRCAGLDDQEKIKSIREITIAWLEETTEFFEQDLNQLDIRMRGEFPYYRELIMSFNPISEMHWIKQKYFDNPVPGVKERLFTLHTTYRDNHYLGSDYHERLEKTHAHDPNNYRVYVEGIWGKVITGMEYYKNFNYGIHVKPTEFDPNYPTHITFDFNVVPYMTCSIWQIKRYKEANTRKSIWYLRGLKEIALKHPKNSTEDTCIELLDNYTKYLESGIVLYGDASGRNRKTSSKKTDWMIIQEMLRQYVVELRVPRMNPLMETRHSFMNRMFYGSLPIVVEIDPEMKLVIEDLSHCLEDGERKKVKSVVRDPISKVKYEKFGHFSDGLDYLACEAFKIFID